MAKGGKREGAGRHMSDPELGYRKTISCCVRPDTYERIMQFRKKGVPVGRLIDRLVLEYSDRL